MAFSANVKNQERSEAASRRIELLGRFWRNFDLASMRAKPSRFLPFQFDGFSMP